MSVHDLMYGVYNPWQMLWPFGLVIAVGGVYSVQGRGNLLLFCYLVA
jgi:hypothetical protein